MVILNLFRVFLVFLIFFGNILTSYALEIIYPKSQEVTINAPSTFFIGNIKPKHTLYINNIKPQIYRKNIFVQVVPLNFGKNTFVLKSKPNKKGKEETSTYTIIREIPRQTMRPGYYYKRYQDNERFIVFVKNDYTPLREADSTESKRISNLDSGTILLIDAEKDDFYRVVINDTLKYWIKKADVEKIEKSLPYINNNISYIYAYHDDFAHYIEFQSDLPVAYKISETKKGLEFNIYNSFRPNLNKMNKFLTPSYKNKILTIPIAAKKLWGYDCYHKGSNIVLKIAKKPHINIKHILHGINITLDAGHGGEESGAIGPSGVREADLVLDITKRLEKILRKEGAKVTLTRNSDKYLDLYERVNIAKANNAQFLFSIHANALPDGQDPYKRNGSSVYYYNPQAKPLADYIKNQLIKDLETQDDGTNYASFVLTRPSYPMSVLIEVAYMINPDDYLNLLDPNYRQQAAESIAIGLKSYLMANYLDKRN